MPDIAKPFELRERADDKLPYDPKNMRASRPVVSSAELKQEPEASAPQPESQPQSNAPAAAQEIQPEQIISDDASEQQSLTFKG